MFSSRCGLFTGAGKEHGTLHMGKVQAHAAMHVSLFSRSFEVVMFCPELRSAQLNTTKIQ